MFSYRNYSQNKVYRTEKIREAENDRLAQLARENTRRHVFGRRTAIVIVTIFILVALLSPQTSYAQDYSVSDAGGHDYYTEATTAYRLGRFYFARQNYERAIEAYSEAIEGIPQAVFEALPLYANIYWELGNAQTMAGHYAEALVSYRSYLELAGDDASVEAVEYVAALEAALHEGTVLILVSG